jgi:hypothetical protein
LIAKDVSILNNIDYNIVYIVYNYYLFNWEPVLLMWTNMKRVRLRRTCAITIHEKMNVCSRNT